MCDAVHPWEVMIISDPDTDKAAAALDVKAKTTHAFITLGSGSDCATFAFFPTPSCPAPIPHPIVPCLTPNCPSQSSFTGGGPRLVPVPLT